MVAGVAELVDARDSKSRDFGHVGSSPTSGTTHPFISSNSIPFVSLTNLIIKINDIRANMA